ncbi:MAG TPA: amylo-alpha-1,6-glucosidase, partial [Terriglobales bacterium]|nr:amylo-alpha-1,6-glucosidase [Terriglobales bacterium]
FWNSNLRCLYDVVDDGQPDASIRPNQIFAVSLHHSMLSAERARAVVEAVERELLTPVGLRTLSPGDPQYRGTYQGDQRSRDSAYHQGTVWPWLLGPFISAYVKVNGGSAQSRSRAHDLLRGIEKHLTEAGIGQISEIFDGDAPHQPRGCFAQAWSVAEVSRVLCEDVYQVGA